VTPQLQATLKRLPDRPGVYLLKDERGDVLYVGKAQSLRDRVRSYWQKQAPPRALGRAGDRLPAVGGGNGDRQHHDDDEEQRESGP
jgi:hypothetical protein